MMEFDHQHYEDRWYMMVCIVDDWLAIVRGSVGYVSYILLFYLVYPGLYYDPWTGILFWINQFGFRLAVSICLGWSDDPTCQTSGALVQVLNQQQAWLPGLQEYLPPWWLSCLTGPEAHAPMVQQARKSWTLVPQEDWWDYLSGMPNRWVEGGTKCILIV
jgi:hypothetical protein